MPTQQFVINKENGEVHYKSYLILLRALMILYECIDVRTAKYNGVLDTLHAFDNKESQDPISFHSLHCKVSVVYYSRNFNAFWLW